jgi:rfaE bifunctional protein kinase chain/domain
MVDPRQLFKRFSEIHVVIVGDSMVDAYLWGSTERISPEAPIPVIRIDKQEDRLGGAGNVAMNIKALGAKTTLISMVGDDEKGKKFYRLLVENAIDNDEILTTKNRITTVKSRIFCDGKQATRFDQEETGLIDADLESVVMDRIQKIVNNSHVDLIIFVDYDKGFITPRLINYVIEMAKNKGILIAADPKTRNFSHYKQVDLFKPNLLEFNEGLHLKIDKTELTDLKIAASEFMNESQIGILLITLSEMGVLVTNNEIQSHFTVKTQLTTDVSGAGDTVISVAGLCLTVGLSAADIAQISNIAGGLVCKSLGVVPVNPEELAAEIKKL